MVNFSKGHLSNVERGTRQPTEDLVQRCEVALAAPGQLMKLFADHARSPAPSPTAGWTVLPRPAQLPPTIADFVGRSEAIAILDGVVESDQSPAPQVIVLDGAAGMGKTTLALWWAHRIRHRFPDGTLFANLHGFDGEQEADPAVVLDHFVRALGVPQDAIPDDLDGRVALLRSLVDGKRVLFVLDNARAADQVRPLLPGSPGCLVLVTSRSRLAGLVVREGALRIGVGPLTAAASRQLVQHVVGARAASEPAATATLTSLCGHQPLALRIGAFRAVTRPDTKLSEIVEELRSQQGRLDLLDAGDDSAAVRSALAWSFRSVPDGAARLFGLLGLHPAGSVSTTAAAVLSSQDEPTTRAQLRMLNDVHLVEESSRDQFIIQDLVHLYAMEQAGNLIGPTERSAVKDRMLHWYLHIDQRAVGMPAETQRVRAV